VHQLHAALHLPLLLLCQNCGALARHLAEGCPEWLLALLQRLPLQICCHCATPLRWRLPVLLQMHCCRC
jgi:hypothetical protein